MPKILFWLDTYLTYFGLAKYLQDASDVDLYALIDTPDKPKSFFQTQQLIRFTKMWFFHDNISKKNKPDLQYLKQFEEKYGISLWLLAFNERIFFKHNLFHKFTIPEIFSILENECRFFETVLDEIQPDYVIMKTTDLHYHKLFHELCRIKKIKILMLRKVRFGGRCVIAEDMQQIDGLSNISQYDDVHRTWEEIQNFLKKTDYFKIAVNYSNKFNNSKSRLLLAAIRFLLSNSTSSKNNFTYYGMNKLKVLITHILYRAIEKIRQFYIDKKCIRNIDPSDNFIFFPLHMQIESVLLIESPFYTNQLETIKQIVMSLPVGLKLYVKDAPLNKVRGWQPISFYKEIMKLPNVVLLHPSLKPDDIIPKCSMVISISSTASMEAAFYKKPSIVFADTDYSVLSSVTRVKSFDELPGVIRTCLKKEVQLEDLNRYVNYIEKNTFLFDEFSLLAEADNRFFYGGFLQDVEIDERKVKEFLVDFKPIFELLTNEHIKKINQMEKIKKPF